jgi:SAM-dependent methyltransferase
MPPPAPSPEILERCDAITRSYFRFHRLRYDLLLEKARDAVQRLRGPSLEILDIGLGFQTLLLQREFPDSIVNTLGFEDERFRDGVRGNHYCFDFNSCLNPNARPLIPPQDLVVMAEVLEHLQVPPQAVLETLASWLRPGGELLLQTPNAVSLPKRLRMLRGYNPFMMPGEPGDMSPHVREYTVAELRQLGEAAGLTVIDAGVRNYFSHAGWRGEVYRRMGRLLPASLRDGITIVYRKAAAR